jgi:hypothetical protein
MYLGDQMVIYLVKSDSDKNASLFWYEYFPICLKVSGPMEGTVLHIPSQTNQVGYSRDCSYFKK